MTALAIPPGDPLRLCGGPYERGRAQAALCPDQAGFVRHAIEARLAETATALARADVAALIREVHDHARRHYPEILEEIRGIADGFGLDPGKVLAYLNCSHAMDMMLAAGRGPEEGCTSFAVGAPGLGAILAKNRDYRPEHIPIQRVFLHHDPAWGGRAMLCVGSLGSPGNFSSGINSDGLAVSDTATRTRRHAPGMHRYFLLTWLLVHCRTVAQALAAIRAMPHAGSGTLVLADADGAVAAVELGTDAVGIDLGAGGRVGRSNHFVLPETAPLNLDPPDGAPARNSALRLAALRDQLTSARTPFGADDAARLLRTHGEAGFCRHGGADLSHTISAAIYDCAARTLVFAAGNPCEAQFRRYAATHDDRVRTTAQEGQPA